MRELIAIGSNRVLIKAMSRPDRHGISAALWFYRGGLDFIINYDIKYRMGKELNKGEGEE